MPRPKQISTPSLIDCVCGQTFVSYADCPYCDTSDCAKTQAVHMSVEYWFPVGFMWVKIIRLHLTYQSNLGPQFELTTLRRVPDKLTVRQRSYMELEETTQALRPFS